ncbi:MAG: sigma-54-dependent transcriptional regulator [Myxococcaceae bacterium]
MGELSGTALLVDDDAAVGKVLSAILVQAGMKARHVRSGEEALQELTVRPYDVIVTDLRMPGMDGMQLLQRLNQHYPEIPVLMLTAHGTVPLAVEAMKAGAADFVLKPFDREEILFSVRKALASARHAEERAQTSASTSGMVGQSQPLKDVEALLKRAAAGTATVLLRGESGTGKELAARAVHEWSTRRQGPFVKIHCAALPDSLLESELFGYEKGAFTGAASRKPGRVELAQNGTLFLDEIGDITPAMQVKLLRLLQDREFERLGGTETLKVDVRFVAATHRSLEQMVQRNEFREDLFYRLNVVPVFLPPLRARAEDIDPLARHFAATVGAANGKPELKIEPDALNLLRAQNWPGNIRQLQNFIERLVVLSEGSSLTLSEVQRELGRQTVFQPSESAEAKEAQLPNTGGTLDEKRREAEKQALMDALAQARNNRTLAARLLGVSRRTLYNKLEEFGIA